MVQLDDRREDLLCTRFETAMKGFADENSIRAWRGRTLTADCVIQIGTTPFLLKLDKGRIRECTRTLPLLCTRDFTIKGSTAAWEALWMQFPPAGWHDLFALVKRGEMSIEGDMQQVMAHLQFIKDILALPRSAA
jgi:hypothetical protein